VGVAWETAVLAGLLDGGLDVRRTDLIVGTSAGSVVGTHIAHGRDARELMRAREEALPDPASTPPPDPKHSMEVFRLWSSFDKMTDERAAAVGKLALAAQTMSEERWLEGFARNGWDGWPETPLLVMAVDCESGAVRAIDREQGVPIERAVAASCAVPGMFPPVSIDGRRYTDGGVRSWTSADFALRIEPDVVLIVAPAGVEGEGVRGLAARQVAREMAELGAAGVRARLVTFDEAAQAAGVNLMDRASAAAAATAGEAHGRRVAGELHTFWG
jgi:NTE family protein